MKDVERVWQNNINNSKNQRRRSNRNHHRLLSHHRLLYHHSMLSHHRQRRLFTMNRPVAVSQLSLSNTNNPQK